MEKPPSRPTCVAGDIHSGSLLHLQTKDIPCVAPSKGMLFPIGLTWGPWRDQIQNKRFGSSRFLGLESSKENQHTETSQSNSKPTSKFVLHHFDPFFWGFGKKHTHIPQPKSTGQVFVHIWAWPPGSTGVPNGAAGAFPAVHQTAALLFLHLNFLGENDKKTP